MLTYLLGPILSLLPQCWRERFRLLKINWAHATVISGFVEIVAGLAAYWAWYFHAMNFWLNRAAEVASQNQSGPEIGEHALTAAALFIFATHPLTWLLAYFCLEGTVRLCGAAFTESIMGTLPLFIAGKIVEVVQSRQKPHDEAPSVVSSFFAAIREKLQERSQPEGPDELIATKNGHEEFLEIRASRRKPDWDPPRVVRMRDTYYRLENFTKTAPPRPFRYTLRKLTAGAPGRTVLLYTPDSVLITEGQ